MGRPKTYHKKSDEPLILALACGVSVETAARQCRVSERTVYRRLQDPAFRTQVQAARARWSSGRRGC